MADGRASQNGKYSFLSDEELVRLSSAGDTLAEEAIVIRYTPLVFSLSKTCFREGWERSDFVQEGMFGLIRAIREFSPEKGASFRAFSSVCIRNEIYGALRKALSKKSSAMDGYVSLSENGAESMNKALRNLLYDTSDEIIDRIVLENELKGALRALQTVLSPFEKKVLSAYLSGYSPSETATALNRPDKSVENALTRIRQKLRGLPDRG